MGKFIFEECWLNHEKDIIKITCTGENVIYSIMICVSDDPYSCYYYEGHSPKTQEEKEEFEKELFEYLHDKYPDHW